MVHRCGIRVRLVSVADCITVRVCMAMVSLPGVFPAGSLVGLTGITPICIVRTVTITVVATSAEGSMLLPAMGLSALPEDITILKWAPVQIIYLRHVVMASQAGFSPRVSVPRQTRVRITGAITMAEGVITAEVSEAHRLTAEEIVAVDTAVVVSEVAVVAVPGEEDVASQNMVLG